MAKLLFLTFCVMLASVVFESAQATCPTCTSTTSTACSALSTLAACYRTVTTANGCAAVDVTAADFARGVVEATMTAAGCSGAGTLMASLGFVMVLTSLAYLFNGNQM